MGNKILLALQYWEGDRHAALELAHFLADLEPSHSELADFIFVHRFDSAPPGPEDVRLLARKFNTSVFKSRRRGIGWPDGCNELWFSTMEWIHGNILSKRMPGYKAIFTFEADGAPLVQDWVSRLSKIWDRVNISGKVCMAGAMLDHGPHINGNALMSGDMNFLTWITKRVGGVNPGCGWDFVLAPEFRKHGWADVPEMKSYYHTRDYTPQQYLAMLKAGLVWIHGVKDNSLIRMGRERMLTRH